MKEVWVPVLDWETHYEVSNLGNVRSCRTGRTLNAADCGRGYLGVLLWVNARKAGERQRSVKVHRLVLESFTGTKNPGMHVAHNDGNRKNNVLTNLRWATISDNFQDRKKHGTSTVRKGVPRDKLTESQVKEILELVHEHGFSSRKIGKMFDVDPSNIDHIRNGRTWKKLTLAYKGEASK